MIISPTILQTHRTGKAPKPKSKAKSRYTWRQEEDHYQRELVSQKAARRVCAMTPAEKYLWRTLNELMPCQWSFGVSAVPFTLDFFHWRSDLVVEILSPHRPAESTSREHRQIVLEAKYGLVIKIIDEDTLRDNPQSVLQSIISMVR